MKKFLGWMFKKEIPTPNWVTKKQRRVRFVHLYGIGAILAAFIYVGLTFAINMFTQDVPAISPWLSLVLFSFCVSLLALFWNAVPTKSKWIIELQSKRSK